MKLLTSICIALLLWLVMAGQVVASEKVNINTADAATLDRVLLNVGPTKAQAIVEYRNANGAFRSPEQLALVKGIGLKTVEKNRDRIMLNSQRTVQRAATPVAVPAYVPPPVQVMRR